MHCYPSEERVLQNPKSTPFVDAEKKTDAKDAQVLMC
jgi:hypothetical protein